MSRCVPSASRLTPATLSGRPCVAIDEVRPRHRREAQGVDDPGRVHRADVQPGLGARARRRRRIRAEPLARVEAMRVAIAAVDEDRMGRLDRDLPVAFVARAVVIGQRPVEVRPVAAADLRPVVRRVEEHLVLDHRPAAVEVEPAVHGVVLRRVVVHGLGRHAGVLELVADLAAEAVGAGPADRVDQEAAGPIELRGLRAAANDGDLRDVVRGRFSRQGAEERQRDVHAVELVHVVLAAPAGARAARRVRRVLHARDEPDQIAVVLADRQALHLVGREAVGQGRRRLVDHRRLRRDRHRFGDGLGIELHFNRRLASELHVRLARRRLHAGERERDRVLARLKRGQPDTRRSFPS